jgi:acetolactate decarboxylase
MTNNRSRFALLLLLATHSGAFAQDPARGLAAFKNAAKNAAGPGSESALFQVSTLDALLQGIYNGSFTVGQLKQQGDFGLGTFVGLDGEMIVVDGHYYHMRANGALLEAADSEISPFAAVTKFKPDVLFTVNNATLPQLSTLIDAVLPSRNFFYAIRIHGKFTAMTTRAIPIQFLPYLPLAQLLPIQSMFTYSNIVGAAVDIRSPAFVSGINQVAHHYHFVSDDLKAGGHSLSFTTGEVTVEIQTLRRYSIWLPNDEPFMNATLPIQ